MSLAPTPLYADDLSSFARRLRADLSTHLRSAGLPDDALPGHVAWLNLLARAAGWRNVQTLKARAPRPPTDEHALDAHPPPLEPEAPASPPPGPTARRALQQFDATGRLVRWSVRHGVQQLCLWAIWTRFDPRRRYLEREVNALINAWTRFEDPATVRREMVGAGLLGREDDCSVYWKRVPQPDADARAFLVAYRARVLGARAVSQNGAQLARKRSVTATSRTESRATRA